MLQKPGTEMCRANLRNFLKNTEEKERHYSYANTKNKKWTSNIITDIP